jgi:rhomboid protease GluP
MNEIPPASDSSAQPVPAQQAVRVALPQSAPYVTYTIIGVTVFVFVLQMLSVAVFGRSSGGADLLEVYGALIGSSVRAGEVWRLITPILLHDNSFLVHILFNMYALYIFGIGLERHFGHRRFLLLYLLGGFSGNVMSFLISSQHYVYSVGASTAIFGLIGAEGVFLYQNRKLFAGQFGSAIRNVIFIVAVNLFIGFSSTNIDNLGHIGGLLGGLVFTWFAGPLWEVESNFLGSYNLVDRRPSREVIIGAATVLLIFGGLAMWGMVR